MIPSGFVTLARLLPWGMAIAALAVLLALISEQSLRQLRALIASFG